MKYLKTFESAKADWELAKQIAEDLYSQLVQRQKSGEKITPSVFDKFIQERGLDSGSSDLILSELVDMGFDLDVEGQEEEEINPGDYVNFKEHGLLYVVSFLGDGILVSDDESQRYEGDNGDGFIIPLDSEGTVIEKA